MSEIAQIAPALKAIAMIIFALSLLWFNLELRKINRKYKRLDSEMQARHENERRSLADYRNEVMDYIEKRKRGE